MAAVQVQHSPPVEAPQSYIKAKKNPVAAGNTSVWRSVRPAAKPAAFLNAKENKNFAGKTEAVMI